MKIRRPPLKSLVVFESAARHLSFKEVAEELAVSPSAVSHQIAGLEHHLGIRLFARLSRELQLTPEGVNFLALIGEALEKIDEATALITRSPVKNILRLQTAPSFGPNWLLPRLEGFLGNNPDLDVRVAATYEPPDFHGGRLDVAISYGFGNFPNCYCEPIIEDVYQVYCAPKLIQEIGGLQSVDDLAKVRLIHTDRNLVTWRDWIKATGAPGIDSRRGLRLDPSHFAISAAVDGAGVVLESSILVEEQVRRGELVAPFSRHIASQLAYYLIYPLENAKLDRVVRFQHWLQGQLPPIRST